MRKFFDTARDEEFRLPIVAFFLIAVGVTSGYLPLYFLAIAVGLVALGIDSVKKLLARQFSLDYIAILAIVVALVTNELLAGSVVSLMILVSNALESYGSREAEIALRRLIDKIPKMCEVKVGDGFVEKKIQDVREDEIIFVRQEEIVPLDGYLLSEHAVMNESNLTGEFLLQDYRKNQFMKSGLVNAGPSVELHVAGDFSTSTYQKIVDLVREAKRHPARIVRLAEKYNYGFTVVTLLLAGVAYAMSGEVSRLLAVLVIATPCPLLIAAPVSFLGGLNKASSKNIIVKRPAALETLSRVTAIFFDKTGTLTLGEPVLRGIEVMDKKFSKDKLLSVAAAIEFHSFHPLAKAIVHAKNERELATKRASDITESVGVGIVGMVDGETYRLKKSADAAADGIAIDMFENDRHVGRFVLDDVIKPGTTQLLRELRRHYKVAILTGDTEENAKRVFDGFDPANAKKHIHDFVIHARCLPEDKFKIVKAEQAKGELVMMVGDGLNDAPALALADVGIVFSGTENSASIDAAAVAILSRDVGLVAATLAIARRSTQIAKQSIGWGIGLSVIGMVFAMFGYIPPVTGAILQEGIDASVILNALRAAR